MYSTSICTTVHGVTSQKTAPFHSHAVRTPYRYRVSLMRQAFTSFATSAARKAQRSVRTRGLAQRVFSDTNGIMLLHAMKTMGRGGIAPRTLATNGGGWSASRRREEPLVPTGEDGRRSVYLDAVEDSKICHPYRKSRRDSSIVHPAVRSIYRVFCVTWSGNSCGTRDAL